jgi:hypothetical protein
MSVSILIVGDEPDVADAGGAGKTCRPNAPGSRLTPV